VLAVPLGATIRGEDMLENLQRELGRDRDLIHPISSLWRALLRKRLLQPGNDGADASGRNAIARREH
jgi:hypothetical protein